jgi:chromosome segregation ATPase
VLFSSTPTDHRELTHFNVQPPEYWAEIFARHGFFRDVDFDASFINPWAVRFRRSGEPLPRIVRGYERAYAQLSAARQDARQYAAELHRDLAQAQARGERRAGSDQERAHLQAVVGQLNALAAALDAQRQALLNSRLDLDRERERVALAAETDRAAVAERIAALDHGRAALDQDRAAVAAERTALGGERAALEQERAALQDERAALDQARSTLAALQAAAAAQEEARQIQVLRESLDETHAHLTRKVLELDAAQAQAAEAGERAHALDYEARRAREAIQLMERSVFWRARRSWVAVKRALGRRD